MSENRKLFILIGHYGVGKTTLAINYAYHYVQKNREAISLADIDVNNPYFRSRDWLRKLEENQIHIIMPELEIAYAEMPFLPKGIYSAIQNKSQKLIIDVGGNEVGTTVLGSLADQIRQIPHSLCFVVNIYRPGTETTEEIKEKFLQLQSISKLTITHILNNSNLAEHTEPQDIIESEAIVAQAAKELGIPFVGTTVQKSLLNKVKPAMYGSVFPIQQIHHLV